MAVFVKLFSGLIFSTVWREDLHVKVVWITLLALCDAKGRVSASVPGLAAASGVTVEQCRDALERLKAPDQDSRTKDYEGRRIADIDGGWQVLNYVKYREMRDEEKRKEQTKEATRRWREKSKKITPDHKNHREQGEPRRAQEEEEEERTTDGQPDSLSVEASVPSATDSPLVGEGPVLPPGWLKAAGTEERIRLSTRGLCSRLLELVGEMEGLDPKHRDALALMRLVTAYDSPDGRPVGGVANPNGLTSERLEKSIADAEWHLGEWRKEADDVS